MKASKTYLIVLAFFLSIVSSRAFATYSCAGSINYLGIGANGDVTVAVSDWTPIHFICSVTTQSNYSMSVPACKAAYAAFMNARLSGKRITIYYNDNGLACNTLPSWGAVNSVYFIEGPY